MSRKYEQAKSDYAHLSAIKEQGDCVETDAEVFQLMADPTKKRACFMYEACIDNWFLEHGVIAGSEEIADRRMYT